MGVRDPRQDSDVDIVLLTNCASWYIETDQWTYEIGAVRLARHVAWTSLAEVAHALIAAHLPYLGPAHDAHTKIAPGPQEERRNPRRHFLAASSAHAMGAA